MTIIKDDKPSRPEPDADGPPSYAMSTSGTGSTRPVDLDLVTCSDESQAGPSTPATAVYGEAALNPEARKASEAAQVPEDEPPSFAPYHAAYKIDAEGNIISHDPHLNADGEALARFLIMHLLSPPQLSFRVVGTHEDVWTEHVQHHDHLGRTRTETKEIATRVIDFDFTLPVLSRREDGFTDAPDLESGVADPLASPAGRLHLVPDDEVVARGGKRCARAARAGGQDRLLWEAPGYEARSGSGGRSSRVKAGLRARREARLFSQTAAQLGLPPFLPTWLVLFGLNPAVSSRLDVPAEVAVGELRARHLDGLHHLDRRGSRNREADSADAASIRAWCDEYCADRSPVKSMEARKAVYGWHLASVQQGIERIIREMGYPHDLSIDIATTSSHIIVRPPGLISKILDAPLHVKLLLTILGFVYVFVALFRLLFGAKYDVVRCSFPLFRYVPASSPAHGPNTVHDARGDAWTPMGERDFMWLQRITPAIREAVRPAMAGGGLLARLRAGRSRSSYSRRGQRPDPSVLSV